MDVQIGIPTQRVRTQACDSARICPLERVQGMRGATATSWRCETTATRASPHNACVTAQRVRHRTARVIWCAHPLHDAAGEPMSFEVCTTDTLRWWTACNGKRTIYLFQAQEHVRQARSVADREDRDAWAAAATAHSAQFLRSSSHNRSLVDVVTRRTSYRPGGRRYPSGARRPVSGLPPCRATLWLPATTAPRADRGVRPEKTPGQRQGPRFIHAGSGAGRGARSIGCNVECVPARSKHLQEEDAAIEAKIEL